MSEMVPRRSQRRGAAVRGRGLGVEDSVGDHAATVVRDPGGGVNDEEGNEEEEDDGEEEEEEEGEEWAKVGVDEAMFLRHMCQTPDNHEFLLPLLRNGAYGWRVPIAVEATRR